MFCIVEEDWGCFLFVQILSKFGNTFTKQAYFQCMSKSLNSFIFPYTKKSYTLVKQTKGKIGKKISKEIYIVAMLFPY